jgi:hypothetical protein
LKTGNDDYFEDLQFLLSIQENIVKYVNNQKENQKLKFLFKSYPILGITILDRNSSTYNSLQLCETQTEIIEKHQFIWTINGNLESFQEYNIIPQIFFC